ncbi:thy-1 membrane glycoprotein [Bufo bufo]|uniref:thy-1 membrane glycoprotein n=1 Tax=Bufo bufo TaxID=8384 RepID=UPI001ABEAD35|nr:thy-1 membrane glycoprotein [Bufo bufo]XP_040281014.1 thy-1 membrane glycoprotein [Bufo bufo]
MNYLLLMVTTVAILQTCSAQKITRFTACLMGRGPTLRLDCRYVNITNNPMRYEFRVTRRKDPEIILSTINLNHFNEKYHNRASVYTERGLVQLHIQRYNSSDLGQYTCTLNIPEDLTINQTVSINVSKERLLRCGAVSILALNTSWSLVLFLFLPLLQAGSFF